MIRLCDLRLLRRRVVTLNFTGRAPAGIDQWAYVPFEVPSGVHRISVNCSFERFTGIEGLAANVLDLGLFDPRGWGPGLPGFRGWSGGARSGFTVSVSDATPGYLPGPITPGTWAVALGPVVFNAAGMPWTVEVEFNAAEAGPLFVPRPAPASVPGRGPGWYRGDLHVHTVHSDGRRTPGELATAARRQGLDFLASTEHNTGSANLIWGDHCADDLLIMSGEEVTTRHGHWLALGLPAGHCVDWRYRPSDGAFPAYADEVRRLGGLVVAAHPLVPVPGSAWQFGYDHLDGIEVWNGPWTLDDHFAVEVWDNLLRRGRRIAALGNSDAHTRLHVVGLPQTVVHADSLGQRDLLTAIRQGRTYLAESAQVRLDLTARTTGRSAGPGESLATGDDPAEVTVAVSGAPRSVVTLHTARGTVAVAQVPMSGTATLSWHAHDRGFVRAEVRRHEPTSTTFSTMVALSNPVWLT
jgi:predicted metal-dependent phosphoesterase TrpH